MAGRQSHAEHEAEKAFLAAYNPAAFERPSVTVDVAILTIVERALRVGLLQRAEHPQKSKWALPGGFVRMDESLDQAAARVLSDKGGIRNVFLEQLYTFGDPVRDPRTRVIDVVYYALVASSRIGGRTGGDQSLAFGRIVVPWEQEKGGPVEVRDSNGQPLALAFDHAEILGMAIKRLRGKLDYTPIGFQLLPKTFTLRALQHVHETILGRSFNKDSFRRRMLASGLLAATGELETEVGHRPAELYRFTRRSAI